MRLSTSVVVFLLTGLIVAVSTTKALLAFFTSQVTNKENLLGTGTVILTIDSQPSSPGIQTTPIFTLENLLPGDSVTKEIFVQNGGTLDLNYEAAVIKTDGDDGLFTALRLKVGVTPGGDELYNGPMNGFTGFSLGGRTLISGSGETLYLAISFPSEAETSLQGKSLAVNFSFQARQSP